MKAARWENNTLICFNNWTASEDREKYVKDDMMMKHEWRIAKTIIINAQCFY